MRILQPATNSLASRLQAVAGALLAGWICGYLIDWVPVLLVKWFWPLFVLAVSPVFLWRLSGWTQGFGFGWLQIFRLTLILVILGIPDFYNEPSTFGKLNANWELLIIGLAVVLLLLTLLQAWSTSPERKILRPAADLVIPALWLPVLAVWSYRYLHLPSHPFGSDFRWLFRTGPNFGWYMAAAIVFPIILFLRPLFHLKTLRQVRPEKPAQILAGLAIEMALIFALFGGFRTLYGLTKGYNRLYQTYVGNFIFSLIDFYRFWGILLLILLVSSYCAVPWKPVRLRRVLLGILAVLVILSVAIHYPVFYRPGQFPAPPASILAPNNSEWRMAIPLDMAKGIDSGPGCREITFYRYLNPVSLSTEEHCIRPGEKTVKVLMDRLSSKEMHPEAARGYSEALNTVSPADFIRYAGRTQIFSGPVTFMRVEPEPDLRKVLESMEHNHLRLYPMVACGFARAFHHYSDDQRAELYLAICGPYKYVDTFNQIYLSRSVVKGRLVEVPWPRDRYRMEFSLSRLGSDGGRNKTVEINADGTFVLTGVMEGKHTGWIIVHGDPARSLGKKKDLLVVYSNFAQFEVNGTDPVDLGDIWIKIFPDHPAPDLLPAASAASWFKGAEDDYWEQVKDLRDPFARPALLAR